MSKKTASLLLTVLLLLAFVVACDDEPATAPEQEVPVEDTENPSVVIENPTDEATFVTTDSTVDVSGSASDNVGVTEVLWATSAGQSGVASGLDAWVASDVPLELGDNTITISAVDSAGNEGTDEIAVRRNNNVNFLETPQSSPTAFYVEEPTPVRIWVPLVANPGYTVTGVRLVKLDDNDNVTDSLGYLYDDGNLNHGDEIIGDGVFSIIQSFDEAVVGDLRLRVLAYTSGFEGTDVGYSSVFVLNVLEHLSEVVMAEAISTQESGEGIFDSLAQEVGDEAAKDSIVDFLVSQTNVTYAGVSISGDIWINYNSGLTGMIMTGRDDEDGGSVDGSPERNTTSAIPLDLQTRGTSESGIVKSLPGFSLVNTIDENAVLSKSALVCGPFFTENVALGSQYDFTADLNATLTASEVPKFAITYRIDDNVTVNALKSLTDFGLFAIHTHGGVMNGDVVFLTGDEATSASRLEHQLDWQAGRLTTATHDGVTLWAIRPAFISNLPGTFPNSIIYNGSCQSAINNTMADAFINKGANTYFGWSETVFRSFNCATANELFPKMITEHKTTGTAFSEIANLCDGHATPACLTLIGNNQTYFEAGLVNGGFEEGDLTGWIRNGDGRVLTGLASQVPQEGSFMGIISTGLGFTVATGSISQSFLVPVGATTLSLDWNFLSEEFDEWVGTQYQDSLVIQIEHDGVVHKVLDLTVDDVWYSYSMVYVSPEIVFDQGDVWMTGWQHFTYDVSAYAGEVLTLTIAAGDVGDSIYDTAILLDQVKVE